MNNHDIPSLYLAGKLPYASNGRNNFRFKGPVLYSYDDVIAIKHDLGLLVNSDTFTATSSRHQSAIKKHAPEHTLVPDLTAVLDIMKRRDEKDITGYILRRKMAISEIERRIESSKSEEMIKFLQNKIEQEKNAMRLVARYLPFDRMLAVFSGL